MDITVTDVVDVVDLVINSSLLLTLLSFFIYLVKKKKKQITEERKDILQDVKNLISEIEKISYGERTEVISLMDAVQLLFGTRNKLNYESLDKEYVFSGLDKMVSASNEEEYIIHKEVVISFLYYFYENNKESFEKEKNLKRHEMLYGFCIPLLSAVVYMILYGVLFAVKSIYVLFGYGLCFLILNVCIIMMGYCLVNDACEKRKRVVDNKKVIRAIVFLWDIVPTLFLFVIDFFMVIALALMSGQMKEAYFSVKLLICLVFFCVRWMICTKYLCSIYNYKVHYIYGFETVTSRIFYERGYDINQLRELAKKIVSEKNAGSIYIKLFVSICDKHQYALYSEKRKLEKVMCSFEEAERLEKVIVCIAETKKLKKELRGLKRLFREYRKRYEKFGINLKDTEKLFLKQIDKCSVGIEDGVESEECYHCEPL